MTEAVTWVRRNNSDVRPVADRKVGRQFQSWWGVEGGREGRLSDCCILVQLYCTLLVSTWPIHDSHWHSQSQRVSFIAHRKGSARAIKPCPHKVPGESGWIPSWRAAGPIICHVLVLRLPRPSSGRERHAAGCDVMVGACNLPSLPSNTGQALRVCSLQSAVRAGSKTQRAGPNALPTYATRMT